MPSGSVTALVRGIPSGVMTPTVSVAPGFECAVVGGVEVGYQEPQRATSGPVEVGVVEEDQQEEAWLSVLTKLVAGEVGVVGVADHPLGQVERVLVEASCAILVRRR